MQLTVGSHTISNYQGGGSTATLKIISNDDFLTSDGVTILRNNITPPTFYLTVNCTVSGTTITVPSFTIDSTTDSSVPNATYTGILYDSSGARVRAHFSGWKFAHTFGASPTWAQISTYNNASPSPLHSSYPTTEDVQALIDAASVSTTSLNNTYSNSLSTAISSIGSTPTTLLIDADTTLSTAVTIPSTLFLKFEGGAKITKSDSGAIAFQGVGLTDATSQVAIFSGFAAGDISWSGATADLRSFAVNAELWSTGTNSVTDRLNLADKAFSTSVYAKIIVCPRPITSQITLSPNRTVFFNEGEYLNTRTPNGRAAFELDSNTLITGSPNARLYEGLGTYGPMIFGVANNDLSASFEGIRIENLQFIGDPAATNNNADATIILGNVKNGYIRNCVFYELNAFPAVLGGYGTSGYCSESSDISNNEFIRCPSQLAVVLNARNWRVANNYFDQRNCRTLNNGGGGTYSVIDIEPNTSDDIVSDGIIEGNIIDARDTQPNYVIGMSVNIASGQMGKNITIRNNKIYGNNYYVQTGDPSGTGPGGGASITVTGVQELYIHDNSLRGGYIPFNIKGCRSVEMYDNDCHLFTSPIVSLGVAEGDFRNNRIHKTSNTDIGNYSLIKSQIYEGELLYSVTTSGSTISIPSGVVYKHYELLPVTINGSDYTISTWNSIFSLTASSSIGTLAQKTWASGSVDTSTNQITVVGHGYSTGCEVILSTTGALPTHVVPDTDPYLLTRSYYIISVTTDIIALARSREEAIRGSKIDLDDTGSGTATISPVMRTKFSSNTYADNLASDSFTLDPYGASRLLSTGDPIADKLSHALHFDETYHQHVHFGYFWKATDEFGRFFYEAWVSPDDGAEYVISDGYGGTHNLLWGFDNSTGFLGITGNVRIDGGNVSFSSQDRIHSGDWHHIAVGWDGTNIYTWIDGVLSRATPCAGVRSCEGFGGVGNMYVGGSNHSNYNGYIRNLRGIEGHLPLTPAGFCPEHDFRNAYLDGTIVRGTNFLIDLSTPQSTIADLSDGFSNGTRQVITNTVVAASGITADGNARNIVTAAGMPNSPKTVTTALTAASHTSASLIAAAMRASLKADTDVTSFFIVGGTGDDIKLTAIDPAVNDTSMNLTIENVTSTGITDDTTAIQTTPGYLGQMVRHTGLRMNEIGSWATGEFARYGGGYSALEGYARPQIDNIPEFRIVDFAAPSVYRDTPASIPGGTVVYDDFSRVNVTNAWYDNLTPGAARTGQTPVVPNGDVGIIDSCACSITTGGFSYYSTAVHSAAVYESGSVTQDVRITRKNTLESAEVGILLRYTDADNYIVVQASSIGYASVTERSAGVVTSIFTSGSTYMGTASWARLRAVVSGTTVTVYDESENSILVATTSVVSGTKAGFFVYGYGRVKSIDIR